MLIKISLALHLRHSSFWHCSDAKPMSTDLVHATQAVNVFSVYVYTTISLIYKYSKFVTNHDLSSVFILKNFFAKSF
jgi:hypothetical protein